MSSGSVCFGVAVRTVSSQCTLSLIVEVEPRKCWIPKDSTSEDQALGILASQGGSRFHRFLESLCDIRVALGKETQEIHYSIYYWMFVLVKITVKNLMCHISDILVGFLAPNRGKEPACQAGDTDLIPELGRSPGEGNGNPLQYSCLENPMERGTWWATILGVAKSQIQLSNWECT